MSSHLTVSSGVVRWPIHVRYFSREDIHHSQQTAKRWPVERTSNKSLNPVIFLEGDEKREPVRSGSLANRN
jgi:hypothetical protein